MTAILRFAEKKGLHHGRLNPQLNTLNTNALVNTVHTVMTELIIFVCRAPF